MYIHEVYVMYECDIFIENKGQSDTKVIAGGKRSFSRTGINNTYSGWSPDISSQKTGGERKSLTK